jgi:cell division protein FtsB
MAARSSSAKMRKRPAGKHLRARTTGIRIVNRVAFTCLVAIVCVAVAVLSVPQVRKLRAMKEELARTIAQETHVRAYKDQKSRELAALRSDPSYLELIARDRLDLYRTGEHIYRIKR